MNKNKWIVVIAVEVARAAITVGITAFVFLHYFHKPLVVLDIKELIGYEQSRTIKLPPEEAAKQITLYIKTLTESVNGRKEIILVKDAVINPNKLKDITNEYKQ